MDVCSRLFENRNKISLVFCRIRTGIVRVVLSNVFTLRHTFFFYTFTKFYGN